MDFSKGYFMQPLAQDLLRGLLGALGALSLKPRFCGLGELQLFDLVAGLAHAATLLGVKLNSEADTKAIPPASC
jgi:hypothetical protein